MILPPLLQRLLFTRHHSLISWLGDLLLDAEYFIRHFGVPFYGILVYEDVRDSCISYFGSAFIYRYLHCFLV